MLVEIWSDVVCPWCYIGKRQFDAAVDRLRTGDDPLTESIEVVYRAYQLDPRAPLESAAPVAEVYARKFGGVERAEQIIEHLTSTAAGIGLDFRMDIAVRANTVRAHRLLSIVKDEFGTMAQGLVKESLLRAYFTEGRNVADVPTLVAISAGALDRHDVDFARRLSDQLNGDEGLAEVNEQMAMAASHGITAVPTYVIDGRFAVPGAQDADTFERVLRRAAERNLR